MKSVKVIFANPEYNYSTSVNPACTKEFIERYFVGTSFAVNACHQEEEFARCVAVEITEE